MKNQTNQGLTTSVFASVKNPLLKLPLLPRGIAIHTLSLDRPEPSGQRDSRPLQSHLPALELKTQLELIIPREQVYWIAELDNPTP